MSSPAKIPPTQVPVPFGEASTHATAAPLLLLDDDAMDLPSEVHEDWDDLELDDPSHRKVKEVHPPLIDTAAPQPHPPPPDRPHITSMNQALEAAGLSHTPMSSLLEARLGRLVINEKTS